MANEVLRGKSAFVTAKKLGFTATMCAIWKQGNNRIFQSKARPEDSGIHGVLFTGQATLGGKKQVWR